MSDHADTSAEQEPQQYGMIFCHDCQAHHTPGWHKGTAAAHPRISVESQQAEDEPIKDDDWLALMREIAKVSADAEEWEDAALNDFWQFDPWDALRKLQAKAPATGISVEELAQRISSKIQSLLTDRYTNSEKIANGIIEQELRAALAALSQPQENMDWIDCARHLPENGLEVETKIDDEQGPRNEQTLKREGNLWFYPDHSMYVYYRPTHWKPLSPPQEKK